MNMKKETIIISGFMGFTIGVCTMMFVNTDKKTRQVERFDRTEFTIRENINTCEDLIEWMGQDVERYADSTVFDTYIWNLEDMIEDNRNLLK